MKNTLAKKIIETEEKNILALFSEKKKIYTFLNPVSYLTALKNKNLFQSFDGIFADGSGLVYAILGLYFTKVTRRSFDMVGIAPLLFNYLDDMRKSIYFIGANEDEIEKAVNIFHAHYPNMNIVGFRNGFFNGEDEINAEVHKVVALQPEFLVVSMGIKKQEEMLVRMRDAGYNGIGFTCGGFIRQTSMNKIDYYPAWVDRWNLRFVYRMIKEGHTRGRYVTAVFRFPWAFVKERLHIDEIFRGFSSSSKSNLG